MEEEALIDAHKLFVQTGYKGDVNKFKNLISTNPDALKDAHQLFIKTGYNKSIDDFSKLVGVKKKSTSTSTSDSQKLVSVPKAGSSGTAKTDNSKKLDDLFALPSKSTTSKSQNEVPKDVLRNKPTGIVKEIDREKTSVQYQKNKKENSLIEEAGIERGQQKFNQVADLKETQYGRDLLKTSLQKHDQATTVDETFIKESVAEADEIAGGNNTWENIKSGAKGSFNNWLLQNPAISGIAEKMGINPYQNTDPLAEEKSKATKKLVDAGVEPKKINESDILNEAKKIYAENKIKDKKLSLSNAFYENLSDDEKNALELNYTFDKNKLTDQDAVLVQNLKITKARIKDLTFDAQPILAKIKNKEQISPEEFKLVEELDKQINTHNDIYDDYQSNSKSLLSAQEELDLVKREYGEVQNFVADIGSAALKFGLGALQTAKTAIINGNPLLKGAEQFIPGASELSSELDQNLGKAQSELENWNQNTFRKNTDEILSINDGVNFVTDLIGNQAPNIALMFATGGGSALATRVGVTGNQLAIGSIGAYSYGNKKNDLSYTNSTGKTNYSNTQIEIASILYGGSEMFESSTLGQLGKMKKFIGASLAEAPTRELFRKSIKDNIISGLKSNSKDVLEENIEEQVTNLIQNYTERNVLGRNDVGLFDNAGEVLKSSTAMALLLKAPQFAGAVAKKFQPEQYNKVLDKNAKEVLSLMNELKKEGLSKQTQDVIGAQITKLSQESDAIVKKTFERIGKLPVEQIDKVVELEKSTSELRAKAEAIQNDEALSKETKESLIKDLSSQFKNQEDLRTKIVSEKATILDILPENEVNDLKKKAVETLLVENAGKNEANFTEEVIDAKAVEIHEKEKPKVYYYNTNPERGKVEQKPTSVPEGYTTIKEIENSYELDKWNKQNAQKTKIPEPKTELTPIESNNSQISEPTETNTSETLDTPIEVQNQITPAENVSPVENIVSPEVVNPTIETKKTEIEKRREEEIKSLPLVPISFDGDNLSETAKKRREENKIATEKINAKYDAELKALENEATPSQDIADDGNIRPSDAVVDQNGSANKGDNQGSVQQPTKSQGDNAKRTERVVKVADSGQNYNVVFENGNMTITDEKGKAPSKPTERKVLEKYSETINFTQGKKSIEAENVNMNDYENMVLEYSENPVEIAEAISFANQKDYSEQRNPIDNSIAEVISSKGIDKNSFIQFGDRNNINQSIAMQYFAKKGKGAALDMIAMDAEYAYFGDYDANNPRITPQDVVDFIMNNQKGVDSFLNNERNTLVKQLSEKFTKLTGLPANDKYIDKALKQEQEINNRVFDNNEVLFAMNDEQLLSLSNDIDTFSNNNTEQNGGTQTNTSNENGINPENPEGSSSEPGIQEARRAEDPGIQEQPAAEVDLSFFENITNQDNIQDGLDWLDNLMLDPNDLKVTLPFLPQTWNAFIEAIKIAYKAGNTMSKAIQEGIKALEALGTSKSEIDAIVDAFTKKAKQDVDDNDGTFKRKAGKKSLLSRLKKGDNEQSVIDALEKSPLDYTVRNQEEAYNKAVEFVDNNGIVESYNAIKNNLIENMDIKALIYNEILKRMPAEIDSELEGISDIAEYSKAQEELYKEFARISSEFSDFATNLGQGISVLNFIYNQNSNLQYELSKQVQRHKASNNGEISPEVLAKFEEADKKIKELSKKITEAEKKLIDAEEQLAVNNIIEQLARAKNPKATSSVLPSAKAKALADKLRNLKIGNRPGAFKSSVGADVIWDSAVEITALAIETTGDITQAVQKGLKAIRESDWYKNLNKNEKAEAEFGFTEFFIDNVEVEKEQEFARYDKKGNLIIPPSLIKKYVAEGFNKIETLTERITEDLENSGFNPTEREVRDAITGYGKTAGKTRPEIDIEIAKLKSLGKLISKLEDLQNGIVKTKSEVKKRNLTEQEKEIKAQIKQLENDLGLNEERRTNAAKTRLKNKIEELKERIANKDYSKKEVKPIEEDAELRSLRAEKLAQQEIFDKEAYISEINNRNRLEKFRDTLLGVWNIPRILMATGEMSWVLIQGGVQTTSNLITNPKRVIKAIGDMFKAMANTDYANNWENQLKTSEFYVVANSSRLALTESDHKLEAREEQFLGDFINVIWDLPGLGLKAMTKNKEYITTKGLIKRLFGKQLNESDRKNLNEQWRNANPMRILERGNTMYMNQMRINRFMDGMQMLQLQGKNHVDNIEEYKKVAAAVNTLTGRANVDKYGLDSKTAAAIFFSFRNWVAKINMMNPYYYASLGNYSSPEQIFTKKPTVAQKIMVIDMIKYMTFTGSMLLLLKAAMGDDEEGNPNATIETDPRSSDFMKLKTGNLRLDPWGGLQSSITFFTRILLDETKSTKTGEIVKGGTKFGSRTRDQLTIDYVSGKFNPSTSMAWNYFKSSEKEVDGEIKRFDKFGNEVNPFKDAENFTPMYWGAIEDIKKEQPGLWGDFFMISGALGINSQVYGKGKEDKK